MASLDEIEGDAIETIILVAIVVIVFLVLWVHFKGNSGPSWMKSLWNAILNMLSSVQAAGNDLFNTTIQRITTANLAGTNTPGDLTGDGGQFDVVTGSNVQQWAQYPLSGVNDGNS